MRRMLQLSFFTKNLLLSSINIILIGTVLIVSSYMIQKHVLVGQLHKQIQLVTDIWLRGLDTSQLKAAVQEKDYDGPIQQKLRVYLTQITNNNPNITKAYVFGTELQDGNKTSIIAVPTEMMFLFKGTNTGIGDMYAQPPEVSDTLSKMLASKQPTFTDTYTDQHGTWTTIAYPLQDEQGSIFAYFAVDADASTIPQGLESLLKYSVTILIVFLVLILLFQYFIVRKTLLPIRNLVRGIERVSQGHFNVTIATGKGELGLINEQFNQMVRKIHTMIVKVKETSIEVTQSARDLLAITEQNSIKSELITQSVQMTAAGIQTQEQATVDSARAMSDISKVIQSIAGSAATVTDEAYTMEQKSLEGSHVVEQVTQQMGLITQSVDDTSKAIRTLENRSQEIAQILKMITGISTQTNLLALNAAIEASRVGEHGKGFAVVAGEVRKLAEQTKQSAGQVTEIIHQIRHEIHSAAAMMAKGTEEVVAGMKIAEQTGVLFGQILHTTKNVSLQIQEVSSATEEISASTEQITSTAAELTATAHRTSLATKDITRTVEEQQTSMKSIVDSSHALTALSEELQQLIAQFNVEDTD